MKYRVRSACGQVLVGAARGAQVEPAFLGQRLGLLAAFLGRLIAARGAPRLVRLRPQLHALGAADDGLEHIEQRERSANCSSPTNCW